MAVTLRLLVCILFGFMGPWQATGQNVVILSNADMGEVVAGSSLELQCQATGLMPSIDFTVVWLHGNKVVSSDGGLADPYSAPRYSVEVMPILGRGDISADVEHRLTIASIQPSEGGQYTCLLNRTDPLTPTSPMTVSSQTLVVDVLYFPDETSPVCSPSGPVEVREGDALLLRCSSQPGNPEVEVIVSQSGTSPVSESWPLVRGEDSLTRQLSLDGVTTSSDGLHFTCRIESSRFPGEGRSCHLGPVRVLSVPVLTSPQSIATSRGGHPGPADPAGPQSTTRSPTLATDPVCRVWLIAFLVAAGIATLAIIGVVILLTLRKMGKDGRDTKNHVEQGRDNQALQRD